MLQISEVLMLKCEDIIKNECTTFQKGKLAGERIFNDCVEFMAVESAKAKPGHWRADGAE